MAADFLHIYCREAEEHLCCLQEGILKLETTPGDEELAHALLRSAHTLKGSSRMMGFSEIAAAAHEMEEILQGVRQGAPVDAVTVDMLLSEADQAALLLSALVKGGSAPPAEPPAPPEGDAEHDQDEAEGDDGVQLLTDTVRVSVKTLDALMTLAGEMIINRKCLEGIGDRLQEVAGRVDSGNAAILKDLQQQMEEDVIRQDYLIQELQGHAVALRMLPLRTITPGFERLVRDLSREQGKTVRLEITGGAIEMDRVLLESLKEMLLHLLTNAICHGVESPAERRAQGKEEQALLTLAARHEGNSVFVSVRDDGRGIDPALLKETAVARGVVAEREAQHLSDEEALQLIFRPGFTTTRTITDVSGRGFGMDVVKKSVERVKGNLKVHSEPGRCTEFVAQLPLTLSVIDALIVECGGERLVVPMSYVQEIIKVGESEIGTVGNREVVKVRGATAPLIPLAQVLGFSGSCVTASSDRISILVLKLFERRIACTIDRHLGNGEVVVKGLGKQFRTVRYLYGATILGDGAPAVILNVADLFTAEHETGSGVRAALRAHDEGRVRSRILVVDDSITSRTLHQSILGAKGYRVETALNGADALAKAAQASFDLVISDVEMPEMDGFELTRKLRGLAAYRETPVVIVSSLSKDEHKRQALDAGAQAYIVKGAFDQGALLETVQMLVG